MAGYVELTEGYEFEGTRDGETGTRVFVPKTDGAQDLPEIDDPFPGHPNCLAVGKKEAMLGAHHITKVYTVSYSTIEASDSEDPDLYPRTIDVGVEMLNIGPGDNYWEGTTDSIQQDMFMRVITATLGITQIVSNFNDLMTRLKICIGKTNSVGWLGQDAKQFLATGCKATEFRNSAGAKRWQADYQFEFRAPDLRVTPTAYGTWESIWRESPPGSRGWSNVDPLTPVYKSCNFDTDLLTT